jgi:hypothetical protein
MSYSNPDTTFLDKIDRIEKAGMKLTARWHDTWSEAIRYFFSDHDNFVKNETDWNYVILNYIWPTAMQEIAKLTKQEAKIIGVPWSDDDADAAKVWEGGCNWQWRGPLKMRLNQIAAILCNKIYGYRVSNLYWEDRVKWDGKNKIWEGDVQYRLWQPNLFWADGEENINDGNCGTIRFMDLEYAIARWPQFKNEFTKISIQLKDASNEETSGLKMRTWINEGTVNQADDLEDEDVSKRKPSQLMNLLAGYDEVSVESDRKVIRVSNTYLKDYQEQHQVENQPVKPEELVASGIVRVGEDQRLYDSMTQQPYAPAEWPQKTVREYEEPIFPNGRNILSAGTGIDRIILKDEPYQYSKWPYIVTPHYLLPFMWQGVNAVQLYKGAQDMINISVSCMVNNLKQFGNPRMVIEDDAIAINPKTKRP